MFINQKDIAFAAVYLIVDILYVIASRSFYEKQVVSISGKGFPSARLYSAFIAYASLVAGWLIFVTSLTRTLIKTNRWHPWVAGAAAGFVYGFIVYGVFNGTMHSMFSDWTLIPFTRDLLWGSCWCTFITGLYGLSVK